MSARLYERRILAIDPTGRGFGYVVLEGPEGLVEWGLTHVGADKTAGCLRRIAELIARYAPDEIVIEDVSVKGSRRRPRIQQMLDAVVPFAREKGVRVRKVAWRAVRRTFAPYGAATKFEIAQAIAGRFPELASRLPRKRRPWMSEDERIRIFGAAASALAVSSPRKSMQGSPEALT